MLAIRYLALAALVVWLGGMVVLGLIVAPTTFRVLQEADPSGGRVLAGALFGELLSQFHLLAYACGGVVLVALFVMKFLGPPPAAFVVRAAIVAAMLAIAVYSGVPCRASSRRFRPASPSRSTNCRRQTRAGCGLPPSTEPRRR